VRIASFIFFPPPFFPFYIHFFGEGQGFVLVERCASPFFFFLGHPYEATVGLFSSPSPSLAIGARAKESAGTPFLFPVDSPQMRCAPVEISPFLLLVRIWDRRHDGALFFFPRAVRASMDSFLPSSGLVAATLPRQAGKRQGNPIFSCVVTLDLERECHFFFPARFPARRRSFSFFRIRQRDIYLFLPFVCTFGGGFETASPPPHPEKIGTTNRNHFLFPSRGGFTTPLSFYLFPEV